MNLDELVIRIQVAADGVEDTLARVAQGIETVAARSEIAAARWSALGAQARNCAAACAAFEGALLRLQRAAAQSDEKLAHAFDRAQTGARLVIGQMETLSEQLTHLPVGTLRLDATPALQAIADVTRAWQSAQSAMGGRSTRVVQNVNFNVPVESPGDTRRKLEDVNLALGRML